MQLKTLGFTFVTGILSVLAVIVAFRMATKESNRNSNGNVLNFFSQNMVVGGPREERGGELVVPEKISNGHEGLENAQLAL